MGADQAQVEEPMGVEADIEADDYLLTRDRGKRVHTAHVRFGFVNFTAFALPAVQKLDNSELETFQEAITWSLMYAMVCSRPDIWYAMSMVSRYLADPGQQHWSALKWILRYIKGTLDLGIKFGNESFTKEVVTSCVDLDYAGCLDTRRSLRGYVFTVLGGCVSWKETLQKVVALSSIEAEYMATAEAIKEALWLKGFTTELGLNSEDTTVHCDNQNALHLMKNPMHNERSKHIDIRLHFIRDIISSNQVQVRKINTDQNPADMLTKCVTLDKFKHYLNLLNIKEA
uniref:Retrovirus-related Pol polyprotein from transposon TNT 1-94 n=1 Tax=Cannabis sativa TaxID=3483 RepID=A0A803QJ04_CANSA